MLLVVMLALRHFCHILSIKQQEKNHIITRVSMLCVNFLQVQRQVLFLRLVFPIYLLFNILKQNKITIITSVLGCGAFLFFFVNIFNISMNSEFLAESTDTADTRFGIWNYAWHAFINNPIIGQGYGRLARRLWSLF
jgi:O-antigen ligase